MPKDTQFGAGKLTITMGAWNANGTQFSNPGTPLDIDIAAGAKLEDVVQAINSKGAGVVASVLKDAQGERLVLRSRSTGADSGFTVDASGDSSLSALAFNGAATSGSVAQYAQNAELTVNGITVQSTTNEFKQTLPGLNITVNQETAPATPVTVTVSSDTDGMKKKIQAFMDAYNALNDALSSSTKYDAESKVAGLLQGDSTTVGMTNSLRSVVSGTVDGGADTLKRLSDMGIQIQKGGKLAYGTTARSEEHTSELQSQSNLVCRLLLEKKKKNKDFQSQSNTVHILLLQRQKMNMLNQQCSDQESRHYVYRIVLHEQRARQVHQRQIHAA